MAVVQISRIQVRRGKKNEGSGLPQLASGEFGWAVDSQELYIGNGSVAEGAPQVGNTRILTANDNIFDFATQYTFRANEAEDLVQTGLEPNLPVIRSVQDRLDETVSVASFGVEGDGRIFYDFLNPTTDVTTKLQHAINQIYLSTVAKQSLTQKIKLFVPAGHYTLTDTIYLPPFISLIGEDLAKTIFHSRANVAFRTVDSESAYSGDAMDFKYLGQPGYNGQITTQARNINLSNFTIDLENPNAEGIVVESCNNSVFSNILIQSTWESYSDGSVGSGITLVQKNNIVTTDNNKFNNIEIRNVANGLKSKYDIRYNIFENLKLDSVGIGFNFGEGIQLNVDGQRIGPSYSIIKDCLFNAVLREGIKISAGDYNVSSHNTFINVGNNGGADQGATYKIIEFLGTGNKSENDSFSRSVNLSSIEGTYFTIPYVPEVVGKGKHTQSTNLEQELFFTDQGSLPALRLPALESYKAEVTYAYKGQNGNYRSGTMILNFNKLSNIVDFEDDYNITGSDSDTFENLEFYPVLDTNIDTIYIRYNNLSGADTLGAEFSYNISYIY